jgi:TPR repeat protein
LGLFKHSKAPIIFSVAVCLLAAACNQKETTPPADTNSQSEAVEKWMAKRAERRETEKPAPEETPLPEVVKVSPAPAENPAAIKNSVTEAAAPDSKPKTVSKEDFAKRLSAIVGSPILSDQELRQKAEGGDKAAQRELARSIASGGNYNEAAKWYRKAAEQGDALAQHDLAVLYVHGLGVTQDFAEAIVWFALAAAQGDVDSQYSLGLRYLKGEHVTQDYAEAAKYFSMAAEQGNADAMLSYGRRFAAGEGVAQDLVEAYKWYVLADKYGKWGAAEVRDSLAKQLTPRQTAEGKQLADAFVPTKKK